MKHRAVKRLSGDRRPYDLCALCVTGKINTASEKRSRTAFYPLTDIHEVHGPLHLAATAAQEDPYPGFWTIPMAPQKTLCRSCHRF